MPVKPYNIKTFSEYVQNNDNVLAVEGLIKTYPVKNLREALGLKIKQLGIKKIQEYTTFTGIPIGLVLTVPLQSHIDEIKKIIDVRGYYISLQRGETIQIEPKYPVRISTDSLPEYAYHITPKVKEKKIKQKGLSPRDSETFFKHTGSRIYLFITKEVDDIQELKEMLAASRNLNPDQLMTLKVILNEPFYYIDTNLQEGIISDESFGIFTMQNISPTFLTATDL